MTVPEATALWMVHMESANTLNHFVFPDLFTTGDVSIRLPFLVTLAEVIAQEADTSV